MLKEMPKKPDPTGFDVPHAEVPAQLMDSSSNSWRVLKGGRLDRVVQVVTNNRSSMPRKPVFILKDGSGFVRLHPEDIIHIQAKGNYVEVHRPRSRVVVHSSLSEVLKVLPPGIMVRMNRSQAVNLRRIERIANEEILLGDMVFTLGRQYREDLLKQVKIITDRSNTDRP